MPTSAPGSSRRLAPPAKRPRGFTLIEVMVVVALIAVATGVVSLALRDGRSDRLDREAARLSALLEGARAEARAAAVPAHWMLTPESGEHQFRFVGLPPSRSWPTRWLDAEVTAQIDGNGGSVVLGPEALIGAQRVRLQIDELAIDVATDGLRPFAAQPVASPS
jgi:general secretion pathway protein H